LINPGVRGVRGAAAVVAVAACLAVAAGDVRAVGPHPVPERAGATEGGGGGGPSGWAPAPQVARPERTVVGAPVGTAASGPPTRVRIPALAVDAPLERLGLRADGALDPPVDYARPGWYAAGTAPGDVGPAVIAGHVDSTRGPAVFFRLADLSVGDRVEVVRDGRWVRFRVTGVERYAKARFPTQRVYGPTPDAQLRLITCGGAFNTQRRSYVDNIVVYAVAD
jgi:hypothetical protein